MCQQQKKCFCGFYIIFYVIVADYKISQGLSWRKKTNLKFHKIVQRFLKMFHCPRKCICKDPGKVKRISLIKRSYYARTQNNTQENKVKFFPLKKRNNDDFCQTSRFLETYNAPTMHCEKVIKMAAEKVCVANKYTAVFLLFPCSPNVNLACN